jgi:hypothetical protein
MGRFLKQYAKSRKGQKNVEKVNALLEFIFWFLKCNAVHLLHMVLKMVVRGLGCIRCSRIECAASNRCIIQSLILKELLFPKSSLNILTS